MPQLRQARARRPPHSKQNLDCGGFSCWHREHFIRASGRQASGRKATLDPKLFRVVDIHGEWEHYFDEETGRYLRGVSSILHRGYAKGFGFYKAMHVSRRRIVFDCRAQCSEVHIGAAHACRRRQALFDVMRAGGATHAGNRKRCLLERRAR